MAKMKAETKSELEAMQKAQLDREAKQAKDNEEKAQKALEQEKTKITAEQNQTMVEFRSEIQSFLKGKPDVYELVNLYDPAGTYVEATVQQHYEDTLAQGKPEILSIARAAELVEQWMESEVEKTLATKKIKAKVNSSTASQAAPKENKEATPPSKSATASQPTKTLNNDMTASSVSQAAARTDAERMRRALASFSSAAR